jgi:hypothetical protein
MKLLTFSDDKETHEQHHRVSGKYEVPTVDLHKKYTSNQPTAQKTLQTSFYKVNISFSSLDSSVSNIYKTTTNTSQNA